MGIPLSMALRKEYSKPNVSLGSKIIILCGGIIMAKAIMAFIITIIVGYFGGVFGYEVMGGFPEFGCIVSAGRD